MTLTDREQERHRLAKRFTAEVNFATEAALAIAKSFVLG
jgi:hypothetical protein